MDYLFSILIQQFDLVIFFNNYYYRKNNYLLLEQLQA